MFFVALDGEEFAGGSGLHGVGSPAQVLGSEQVQELDKRRQAAFGEGIIPVDCGASKPVIGGGTFAVDSAEVSARGWRYDASRGYRAKPVWKLEGGVEAPFLVEAVSGVAVEKVCGAGRRDEAPPYRRCPLRRSVHRSAVGSTNLGDIVLGGGQGYSLPTS